MLEKHLLPLTFSFPKEMIKKLKKHFHMEDSDPNRSPQDTSNTIKQEELKKKKKAERTHMIFSIRKKNKIKRWVTLHSSEHHLAVKYVLNLPNLLITVKV